MTKDRLQTPRAVTHPIDTAPLLRLLKMAGPNGAPGLITAFLDDLKSTETGLDPAWIGPDCAALRLHSHGLIALAGTVGDTHLQATAQRLNALARGQDYVKIRAMKAQTMHGLANLIATLTTLAPPEE